MDVCHYAAEETLHNGLSVMIRAIRPNDKSKIIAAFEQLEPQSIYTRFFQYKRELSEAELQRATEVDFENEVALVATVDKGERETIIGSGRYVAYTPPEAIRSAEIAFIVEEDYQGQGIASRLLRHLTHIAREKGVKRFTAEVLPDNPAMLAMFSGCGLPMETKRRIDIVKVILRLDE
ncbi:MAG: GNAT family N-acetyltransferase [Candidatus Competibacteraceae bacterium]|uniref:GCN5-related N-acetyltransferase n=1 Tax=Candidatus Contendobacter odensis Run_B_J11 TaxID=1400861 RepID=A0A7U7J3G3_9GAMM|nr:GNAT family N-acetyltransferase [Candidatus Contendobacter odensis]MBK8535461.1 GNAT family N-acetyltransferase [Candidatus Competibacteraceae bacterium]MBK8752635.1 GNAT family N-acetyltransferase [Candidatus Competibacteraceae bacterium]CDH45179.1 GCN5-related N-acetyltransferase [Candidatus Contendobacter odensis Run_B_J11]